MSFGINWHGYYIINIADVMLCDLNIIPIIYRGIAVKHEKQSWLSMIFFLTCSIEALKKVI